MSFKMLLQFTLLTLAALPIVSSSPVDHYQTHKPKAPSHFTHPGVLLDTAQLNLIQSKVAQGAQPWSNAYSAMLADPLASLSRIPSPTTVVQCGPTSTPNIGCTAERQDALAAYAMSLAWYISDGTQYAQKAMSYMNAWAQTIQAITIAMHRCRLAGLERHGLERLRSYVTAMPAGLRAILPFLRICFARSIFQKS